MVRVQFVSLPSVSTLVTNQQRPVHQDVSTVEVAFSLKHVEDLLWRIQLQFTYYVATLCHGTLLPLSAQTEAQTTRSHN
jgi:hypothetical protein